MLRQECETAVTFWLRCDDSRPLKYYSRGIGGGLCRLPVFSAVLLRISQEGNSLLFPSLIDDVGTSHEKSVDRSDESRIFFAVG